MGCTVREDEHMLRRPLGTPKITPYIMVGMRRQIKLMIESKMAILIKENAATPIIVNCIVLSTVNISRPIL